MTAAGVSQPVAQRKSLHQVSGERIPALDGLRGVAALMVMCLHFGPHIAPERGSLFSFVKSIPPFWFEGVDLFFVLSGFLISGILLREFNSPRYFRTFYARRAFRILPVYGLVLASYWAAIFWLGPKTAELGRLFVNPLPAWSYALFVQNFYMITANSFGAIWMAGSWSLAVEEQFYLTLPALVRAVTERTLFRFAVAGVVLAPLLRALVQKFRFLPGMATYVALPACLDALGLGVLAMLLLKSHRRYLEERKRKLAWVVLAAFVFWTVYPLLPNPQAIRMAFLNRTGNSLVFAAILILLVISPGGWLAQLLSGSAMRRLGNMAYSTYLLHPILLCIAFRALQGKDPELVNAGDLRPLLVAATATFALSFASWTFFERRLIGIGHRFHY